ncbi:MAG TPA: iron-sulfur cluster assembly protein [Acetobacteraceae bacterium]|nr:iron-sulfur cluster assembly protein [Acetobacteraceae bacterium]
MAVATAASDAARPDAAASRRAELLARLEEVLDPELDRSVVEMGFIQELHEAGGEVTVAFRLPTHWCAAAFAFLMASDMQAALEALPWVTRAEVRLLDHFAAGRINRAIAGRGGLTEAFPDEPGGDLGALRRRFAEKAFLGRQERVLRALIAAAGAEAALRLTLAELEALAQRETPFRADALRYVAIRRRLGGPTDPNAAAFTDLDGVPVTPDCCTAHLRAARRARSAAEANAEHCRLLIEARRIAPAPEDRTSPSGLYE